MPRSATSPRPSPAGVARRDIQRRGTGPPRAMLHGCTAVWLTSLAARFEQRLIAARSFDEAARRAAVTGWWRGLPYRESFLVNKLPDCAASACRRRSVVRALPRRWRCRARTSSTRWATGVADARALGPARQRRWHASGASQPHPFYLASPLEADPATRCARRLARRVEGTASAASCCAAPATLHLWSRGEELVSDRFPEIVGDAAQFPARWQPTAGAGLARQHLLPPQSAAAHRPQEADAVDPRAGAGALSPTTRSSSAAGPGGRGCPPSGGARLLELLRERAAGAGYLDRGRCA